MSINKDLRNAIMALFVVFVVIGIVATLTKAHDTLTTIRFEFLIVAAVFFIFSILLWLFCWSYIIKKRDEASYGKLMLFGFMAVFGSLTPIQIGAEAIRAHKLKKYLNIPYTHSISASLVVKGMKFFLLALFSTILLLLFLLNFLMYGVDPIIFFALISGFMMVIVATLLFLLPIYKPFGKKISKFFLGIKFQKKIFHKAGVFFDNYSEYMSNFSFTSFLTIFMLAFFSWVFEFLALHFSFVAFRVVMPIQSTLFLLILISVLERTPFLPRGIGIVELVTYNFLAFPQFSKTVSLTVPTIGGVLIVYDLVRLVVPTILSIFLNLMQKVNMLNLSEKKQHNKTVHNNN